MVYPTPGIVVRGTFLEVENEEVQEPAPVNRRERSYTDTELMNKTQSSQFGSEELRLYCEMRDAEVVSTMEIFEQFPHIAKIAFKEGTIPLEEDTTSVGTTDECANVLTSSFSSFSEEESVSDRPLDQCAIVPTSSFSEEESVPDTPLDQCAIAPTSSFFEESVSNTPLDQCTTVMLSNLPVEYSRFMLVQLLAREGFACTYDFVFLPMDLRTRTGNGYALVNFHSNNEACRALVHFDGFMRWSVPSSQVCVATWSRYIQGIDALIERHRNSPIMHEAVPEVYKPAMYASSGAQMRFPEPTKRVRMPRLRRKTKEDRNNQSVGGSLANVCEIGKSTSNGTERSNVNARQAAGRNRNKNANSAPGTWARDANNDAWFVDLVSSRIPCQVMRCGGSTSAFYGSKVDTRHFGTPPELLGLGGCETFSSVLGQRSWLM